MKFIGTDLERQVEKYLFEYIPKYYETSKTVNEIMRVDSIELEAIYKKISEVLNQNFVDTSTWGLERWEDILNIETNENKSDEERRSVIRSHLRGVGTATVKVYKSVAEAYDGGEVDVIEFPDEYRVNVKFIGTRGVPTNLDDTKSALINITPAHLELTFEFTYITWSEIDSDNLTWNDVTTENLTYDEFSKSRF